MSRIKDNFKRLKNIINETEGPDYVCWTIFVVIALFIFISFAYWDILVTTSHTTNFIEVISSGRISDFYIVNYNLPIKGISSMVCYDLPIYLIFMVWDFPLWVLKHFYSVNIIDNFWCLLWMKGILILFLYLCSMIIKKICQEVGFSKENIRWTMFIFVSSPLIFSSVFILCQYDIIPMFFMLLGILAYIRDDQKKFLLWFSIAIPMKILPLFVFIPLLLLKEKRVLQIIGKCFVTLLCLIVFRIIAMSMPYYDLSTKSFNNHMISRLFSTSTLKVSVGTASLFVAAYAIICVYCYIKELKNKKELYQYSMYIPFAVFNVFFLFVYFNPYWLVYLTPFFAFLLFNNSKYFKANLLIEIVFNFVVLFIITNFYTWCFGAKELNGMLISKIFGTREMASLEYRNVGSIYSKLGLNQYLNAFYGLFLALSLCLLVVNSPLLNKKKGNIEIERSTILFRALLIMFFAFLMICCYFS